MKNLIKLLIVSGILVSTTSKTLAINNVNSTTFILPEESGEPLSDTLATFYAEQQSEEVHIHWSVAPDQLYDYFAVEMSTDGKDFFEIGNLKGTEYTTNPGEYLYIHKQAVATVSFYRIKKVGSGGNADYSKVIKSDSKKAALVSSVKIYPNPVSNIAEVSFTFSEKSVYILTITDNSGRVALTQTGTGVIGNNILPINMENQIAGIYYIYITGANGLSHVSKFVKD